MTTAQNFYGRFWYILSPKCSSPQSRYLPLRVGHCAVLGMNSNPVIDHMFDHHIVIILQCSSTLRQMLLLFPTSSGRGTARPRKSRLDRYFGYHSAWLFLLVVQLSEFAPKSQSLDTCFSDDTKVCAAKYSVDMCRIPKSDPEFRAIPRFSARSHHGLR